MQMLLLEGDDMNQKTGICILLCLVLLLVFGIWLFFYRMEKPYIWKPGFEVRI